MALHSFLSDKKDVVFMFIVKVSKVDQGFLQPIKICVDVQISHENTRGNTKTMKQR